MENINETTKNFKGSLANLITVLAESLAWSWLLLFLLEQLRPGLVSIIWNLNLLLFITLFLLIVSLFFNTKTAKVHSLAGAISVIILTLVIWQLVPLLIFKFVALAAGIASWLIFYNSRHD